MNKENDYLDKIIIYDENDISDVEVDTNELTKIKKDIIESIKNLKKRNRDVDLDISFNEVKMIMDNLGDEVDKSVYGIKHAVLLKEIVIKGIEEEFNINDGKVINKAFVTIPASFFWYSSIRYYQLYLKEDKILYYGFNVDYTLIKHDEIKIDEIIEVGNKGNDGWMSQDELIIKSKDKLLTFYTLNGVERENLLNFIESIVNLGVYYRDNKKNKLKNMIFPAILITIIISTVYILFNLIKQL